MNNKLNFMIIGCGFIFSRHEESIEKIGGKILLTVDNNPKKKADYLNYKEAFLSSKFKDVNYIIICTPNHLHKQMIKDALATNRKVLCEKPLIIDNGFERLEGVKSVLQLRYHDLINDIKKALKNKNNKIELIMKVCRSDEWWDSWRGDESKTGGILLGIAIHMFDFLIFLLGDKYVILKSDKSQKKCTGIIKFPTAMINYHVEILDNNNKKEQTRKFIINGKEFELCNKNNLSFAGYHDQVYENFIKGNGIPLSEAKKSIELILQL